MREPIPLSLKLLSMTYTLRIPLIYGDVVRDNRASRMEGFSKIVNCFFAIDCFGEAPFWMFDWLSDYITDMNDEEFYQKVALYVFV